MKNISAYSYFLGVLGGTLIMNYFLRLITGKPSFTSGVLALSGILMIAFVFHYASKHKDEIIPEYSVEEEEKRVLIYPSRISFILYCIYLLIILIGIYVMCIGISQAELKIAILLSLIGLFSIKITYNLYLICFIVSRQESKKFIYLKEVLCFCNILEEKLNMRLAKLNQSMLYDFLILLSSR